MTIPGKRATILILLFFLIAALAFLQGWTSLENTKIINDILQSSKQMAQSGLADEKSRQEVITLRIKNEAQTFFWNNLFTTLGPLATTIVALFGAFIGLRNFLDAKDKDRMENAANDLKSILEYVVDENHRHRIVGVVGLQHFFTKDKADYHLRALASLAATARLERDDEVKRHIRIATEQAAHLLNGDVFTQVSWQHVDLRGVDFSGCVLEKVDFRDAVLEDALFRDCKLKGTRFLNARLNGANFQNADLTDTDFTYADLAGANFKDARLDGAKLYHAKVLRMNLENADLRKTEMDLDMISWPLVNRWRNAKFDDGVLDALIAAHGPEPTGTRILMLMWEIPPLVAGGTWTACYYLVRSLVSRGVKLTVIVPWSEDYVSPNAFDCDVEVVSLGIVPPDLTTSAYGVGGASLGAYASVSNRSPYAQASWVSPYGQSGAYHPYGGAYSPYHTDARNPPLLPGSGILRIAEEYARRLVRWSRNFEFDVVHAHDWVTFSAARLVAEKRSKPWVAHFHSTEAERRPNTLDNVILRIEHDAANSASAVVTPSRVTQQVVKQQYRICEDKVIVVPNSFILDEGLRHELGSFESKQIVFTGRLTTQKGPDLYLAVAQAWRYGHAYFSLFGAGEMYDPFVSQHRVVARGALQWQNRFRAFSQASAVLVTSRSEPFGMVILEAMQSRVPVLYPASSGAAEVFDAGIKIDPNDTEGIIQALKPLLENWQTWEDTVEKQVDNLERYCSARNEQKLVALWDRLLVDVKNPASP